MNNGIIYIVGGHKYARWTLRSVLSLKQNAKHAGQLPIHVHFMGDPIYENQLNNLGCTCICHPMNKNLSGTQNHRKTKAEVMQSIVFEKYVMIDADTFVQGDFIDMFDQIPRDGIAGIIDGNFQSHLQMAKFLFIKGKVDDIRKFVLEVTGVDYGLSENFPPYFNVGVIGMAKKASCKLGEKLFPLLDKLQQNPNYNPHDEQLPMNAIMYLEEIPAIAVDPIYNYTRSRMKANIKSGLHETVKDNVRIIHNRHFPKEATWVDQSKVNKELEYYDRVARQESSRA